MTRSLRTPIAILAAAAAVTAAAAACTRSGPAGAPPRTTAPARVVAGAAARDVTELGPLRVRGDRITDTEGRQVLLRGPAVNALGDYYQADPALAPVAAVDGSDWDLMAASGFSAVRLVVSWSRTEPAPGRYDDRYTARVAAAVDQAARRGMYTVIDMHQDAWGRHIATEPGTVCPDGLEPAIGWDGAPQWATVTGGAGTCRTPGVRESSDAVRAAFTSFWHDTDRIATRFAAMWGHLVTELGDRPGIAGYDLLNEPLNTLPGPEMESAYTRFVKRTTTEIRRAEKTVGRPPAPVFLEPVISYPLPHNLPDYQALGDTNTVFSPHIYPVVLTRSQFLDADQTTADAWGTPLWIGEFSFGEPAADHGDVAEFLNDLDRHRANWSWWLWQTGCGDPHYLQTPDTSPARTDYHHLMTTHCPEGTDEPTTGFLRLAARGYPRTAPGRITALASNPETGTLTVDATGAQPGQTLTAWLPRTSTRHPDTTGTTGLTTITTQPAGGGGTILTATTTNSTYTLRIAPPT